MKKFIYLFIVLIMISACNNKQKKENPFFAEWNSEFGLPPFAQIEESDYIPAVEEGIKQHDAEVQGIIDNKEEPTFANTIEVFDHSGRLLSKVVGVLFNLSETNSSESLNGIVEKVMPMLSEHNDNIYMNPQFFKRIQTVYNQKNNLGFTTEQQQVLDKIYKRFTRNGIDLPADKQARLREVNKQISLLENKFSINLLAQTNAFRLFIDRQEDLAGLPQAVVEAAAADAKAADRDGKWLFTLKNPSYVPFMQYSQRRDLREKMFEAYSSRGNHNDSNDNKQVIIDLMTLRIEKVNLLGFKTPADFILDETLAKTPQAAYELMNKIMPAALKKAKEEVVEMQKIIDAENGGFKLQPWDWAFYAEKLRKQKYDLDEAEISQYFKMENVREGVFACASKLYGLKFEPLKDASIYYSEVEAFKVTDENDSLVGILYTDYYPRDSKRGGAWMNNFRDQQVIDGNDIRPIIVNVGNFTKPTPNKPSLLTLDEVGTMFHEFGHALHGLLSKCHYSTVSGTSTPRDFVEMPSQINENWAFEPEVLAMYAKHYDTGEIIPDSLVQKIKNSGTFNQGFMTTELVAAALLDMDWHTLASIDGIDVEKFEQQSIKKMGLIDEIIPRYRSTYFNHIFNTGYSAGYYSYLWSEMLDKDAFEMFRKNGIFDFVTAKSFKDNILSKGSSDDLMVLYRKFRGANPSVEPMLKGRGLK
ncbi:MAG: M3 family metallopeptidase [Prevotellaceae bacterium]|jgi:peptidyl-dipeptidase Dcp|nr:M3 family metallopeptidase [Prevotellaceae bacterium]